MGLWQDVVFAGRLLVKDRWFSLVAIVALALGIGVNATVFTLVNAVLLRGLPFANSDELLVVTSYDPVRARDFGVSYLDYQDWRDSTRTFANLAVFSGVTVNLSDEDRPPERYSGVYVSSNAFAILHQPPILGRDFAAADDQAGATPVVLIGHSIWKNRYNSHPDVLGRTVRVNDTTATIVGVMPENFRFPQNSDLWMPLAMHAGLAQQARNVRGLEAFGRLAPDVRAGEAQAELITIGARLATDYPDTNKDVQPKVQTFNERQNGGPLRAVFLSLMGAVGFVLLIACANVANLLLARSAQRAREIAVRVSIGATRARIIRQLLIESLLLALVAGALGLVLSLAGIRLFDAATFEVRPYWIQFTIDTRVLAFLAAVCLGTAMLFGLAPALHVSKADVNEILKEGGRSGSAGMRARRWSGALIIGELALTLALLAGAGFMMRNFLNSYRLDVGIETSRLLTMQLTLPERKYPSVEQRLDFYQRLQERLVGNGRIRAVSVASQPPIGGGFGRRLEIEGRPRATEQPPVVTVVTIDPRYFETVGAALERGRAFTAADGAPGQDTVIVNRRFLDLHFPEEDALGRRVTLSVDTGGAPPAPDLPTSVTATIVGIAPNIRQRNAMAVDPDPVAYLPFRAEPRGSMMLLARADGDPNTLTPLLREEVRALDPDLPLFNIRTLDQALEQQRWPFRIFGTMFAFFAGIALVLSAVGLYAVTAYSVTQRTQEIGVRTALGAGSWQVMSLFLRRALVQLAIGLTLGIAAALGVGKLFENADLLVQVNGHDPVTILSIAALLAVVAIAACLWPARRATTLDPLVALRGD